MPDDQATRIIPFTQEELDTHVVINPAKHKEWIRRQRLEQAEALKKKKRPYNKLNRLHRGSGIRKSRWPKKAIFKLVGTEGQLNQVERLFQSEFPNGTDEYRSVGAWILDRLCKEATTAGITRIEKRLPADVIEDTRPPIYPGSDHNMHGCEDGTYEIHPDGTEYLIFEDPEVDDWLDLGRTKSYQVWPQDLEGLAVQTHLAEQELLEAQKPPPAAPLEVVPPTNDAEAEDINQGTPESAGKIDILRLSDELQHMRKVEKFREMGLTDRGELPEDVLPADSLLAPDKGWDRTGSITNDADFMAVFDGDEATRQKYKEMVTDDYDTEGNLVPQRPTPSAQILLCKTHGQTPDHQCPECREIYIQLLDATGSDEDLDESEEDTDI